MCTTACRRCCSDRNNRDEMMQLSEFMASQPQGRKQTGPGAENHWWNLLSYVYDRVPSLLFRSEQPRRDDAAVRVHGVTAAGPQADRPGRREPLVEPPVVCVRPRAVAVVPIGTTATR